MTSRTCEEEKQKRLRPWQVIFFEIFTLAVLSPIVLFGAVKLLIVPIGRVCYPHTSFVYGGIYIWITLTFILVFDIAWIILMILWPFKNTHVKIILTWLVLISSAAVMACLAIGDALDAAFS